MNIGLLVLLGAALGVIAAQERRMNKMRVLLAKTMRAAETSQELAQKACGLAQEASELRDEAITALDAERSNRGLR